MLGRLFYFLLKIYFHVISGIMLGRLFYFLLKTYFHVISGIMLGPLFYFLGNKSLGGSKTNGLT
jgi:F0F1-type ATP synthase assembly protein I